MDDMRLDEEGLLRLGSDDEGNAQAVVARYPDRFLYTAAYGWMAWTGTHWEARDAEARLDRAIVGTLEQRQMAAARAGHYGVALHRRRTASAVKSCKYMLTSILWVSMDEFDNDPDQLNCANGVLDLRTGHLTPHEPCQRFTYVTGVAYDPDADQTTWTQFLSSALGDDPDLLSYLQEAVGYSLTGHTNEEVIFYLTGPTRSGKGTFTETLLATLGWSPLAEEVEFATFTADRTRDTQNFDLAGLKPCRLLVASEPSRRSELNAPRIKALTGGNRTRCAHKHREFFSYRPQYKIWVSSNYRPKADVDDGAAWGRLRVLLFPKSWLGHEDKHLKRRLLAPENLAGVLAWAVQGALRWHKRPNGLEAPACVMAATEKARAELDYVALWLDECVEQTGNEADFVPNEDLHANYTAWCTENGVTPVAKGQLTKALRRKSLNAGIQKSRAGHQQRGCGGVKLLASNVDA